MFDDFPFSPGRRPPRRFPFGKFEPGQLSATMDRRRPRPSIRVSESRVQSPAIFESQTNWHFGARRNEFGFYFSLAAKNVGNLPATPDHPPHRMQTAFIVVKQLEQSETNTQTNPTNLQTLAKVKQNSCLNNGKHKPRAIETRIHLVLV